MSQSSNPSILSNPYLLRCCLPTVFLLLILYIILFFEIHELDFFQYIDERRKQNIAIDLNVIENNDPTQHNNNAYKDERDNSKFVAMWHYIHETDFTKLSPALQTRKLHELFRYKYVTLLLDRMKQNQVKTPSDFELAVYMSELYDLWNNSEVNFIQIGACDGNWQESNDPIQKLILSKPNWHGVMMEPVPYLFDTLTQNIKKEVVEYEHRIFPINAAMSDTDGKQTFYTVNKHFAEEMPHETHALKFQIGSFNKEHIYKHLRVKKERKQLSQELDYYITPIEVTAMTPNTVLQEFRKSGKAARDGTIDVLTIDAEGYDYKVLRQFLENTGIRPILIMYENLHLKENEKKAAIDELRKHGYKDFGMGWNTLGVRIANIR